MEQSTMFCRHCNSQVLAVRPSTNHVLHLLITLFLCGLWIPVWILASIKVGGWRCSQCGRPGDAGGSVLGTVVAALAVVMLFVAGLVYVGSRGRGADRGAPQPHYAQTTAPPARANSPTPAPVAAEAPTRNVASEVLTRASVKSTPPTSMASPQRPRALAASPQPSPAATQDLNAQLQSAQAKLVKAQNESSRIGTTALNILRAGSQYQTAKKEADDLENRVKALRASSNSSGLAVASQQWIAAKGKLARLEADAQQSAKSDPKYLASEREVVRISVVVDHITKQMAAQNAEQEAAQKTAEWAAIETAEPHDDLTLFISRFGPPDSQYNSEDEKPRPLIVTRQLIYEKENLRVVYRADAPAGAAPPYKKWKLMGFQNHKTDAVIKPDEVVELMRHRDKRR